MTRDAAAVGFYPQRESELEEAVQGFLKRAPETNINPKGLIVPHAGYRFSGETSAYAYKSLKSKEPKNAVILGFNHRSIGREASLSTEDWRTPLGELEVNRDLTDRLLDNPSLNEDNSAHEREHSIEVQLPFLQYLFPDIKIVPISLSNKLDYMEVQSISQTLKEIDYEENILIASSDLMHVGRKFNVVPEGDALEYTEEQNDKFIEKVKSLDTRQVLEFGGSSTVCGYIPVSIAMETLKEGIKGMKVLHRSNSYEVSGDKSTIVGYLSAAFL